MFYNPVLHIHFFNRTVYENQLSRTWFINNITNKTCQQALVLSMFLRWGPGSMVEGIVGEAFKIRYEGYSVCNTSKCR